jgi:hypothetical protein
VVSLGIFSGGLPTEPCALGSTRNSSGGEGGRCVELTTNYPSSAERKKIRGLNLPGPPRAPGGLLREYLYLYPLTSFVATNLFCASIYLLVLLSVIVHMRCVQGFVWVTGGKETTLKTQV